MHRKIFALRFYSRSQVGLFAPVELDLYRHHARSCSVRPHTLGDALFSWSLVQRPPMSGLVPDKAGRDIAFELYLFKRQLFVGTIRPFNMSTALFKFFPMASAKLPCLRIARAKQFSQPLEIDHQHRFRAFISLRLAPDRCHV